MRTPATLLLKRSEVSALLDLAECIAAIEAVFREHGEGRTPPPGILSVPALDGAFHIKAGVRAAHFVAKTNGNFPQNRTKHGLPTIQGVILVYDAANGAPLAILDSTEITLQRTGAATAVATRYLARPDASVVTICGCGNQGRISLRALAHVRRLRLAHVFDRDPERAARLARELGPELGFEIQPVRDLGAAARRSDICVTCTTSTQVVLRREDVAPGAFVAAVGADNPDKHEVAPEVFAASTIIVDILEQSATVGDLHHALAARVVTRDDVHAELGAVVAGRKPGRTRDEEIVVFDSTGMALQDAAAAAVVYEKALRQGIGTLVHLTE